MLRPQLSLLGGVAALALLAGASTHAAAQAGIPPDFTAIIQQAKKELFPKTVYIKVVYESFDEGKKTKGQSSGSGVIISSDG